MKKLFGSALVGVALGVLATKYLQSAQGKKAKANLEKKARTMYDSMKTKMKEEWEDFEKSAKEIKKIAKNVARRRA